jgi:hypothetical protein
MESGFITIYIENKIKNMRFDIPLIVFAIVILAFMFIETSTPNVQVGDQYIIRWDDEKDPFDEYDSDTLTITGVKNGYIQTRDTDGHFSSWSIDHVKTWEKI